VFGFLFALYILRAALAVFGVVGGRLKRLAADGAPFCSVIPENLRFQRLPFLIFQQHMTEEFAVDGVGNALYTDAFLTVIQQQAVAVIIVAAEFAD